MTDQATPFLVNGNGDRCSAVERCSLPLRVRQSAFGFSSVVAGPMANAGEVSKFLRWGHGGPLSESSLAFCALRLEPSLQRLLRSIIRLLAGWSFVRHCRTHAGV